MENNIENYLESVQRQFLYYKMLGDKTFCTLSDSQIHFKYNEASNSIADIVRHVSGNMLSRWTNFLTEDGEKPWRNRDTEFEANYPDKIAMITDWEKGWQCLFDALGTINAINFQTLVYIRNQGHTITEAINRQLAHYPYHIGQIVFIGKMIAGNSWQSLSIPKNQSENYNTEKFTEEKKRAHYLDDELLK